MEENKENKGLSLIIGLAGGFLLGAYFFSKKDSKVRDKITDEIGRFTNVLDDVKEENVEELEKIQGSIETILSNIETRIKSLSDGRKED
jgi:DNA-binding transcriptional regulator GbsR (MarR family)